MNFLLFLASNRYITDRFLPDKAVDLVDEAASKLRLQQESKPEIIERIDREIIILKIESEALRKESDANSRERLEKLKELIREKEDLAVDLNNKWEKEKQTLKKVKDTRYQIEKLNAELQLRQREGKLARASEIMYGLLPKLQAQLPSDVDKQEESLMLSDCVTEEHIAEVISRRTGIPLEKLLVGEKQKLLKMEEEISREVIGQPNAVKAVSNCIRISRAGLHTNQRPVGTFLFLGPTGVGNARVYNFY